MAAKKSLHWRPDKALLDRVRAVSAHREMTKNIRRWLDDAIASDVVVPPSYGPRPPQEQRGALQITYPGKDAGWISRVRRWARASGASDEDAITYAVMRGLQLDAARGEESEAAGE